MRVVVHVNIPASDHLVLLVLVLILVVVVAGHRIRRVAVVRVVLGGQSEEFSGNLTEIKGEL